MLNGWQSKVRNKHQGLIPRSILFSNSPAITVRIQNSAKFCTWGGINPCTYLDMLGSSWISFSPVEKNLWDIADAKLNMSYKHSLIMTKANKALDCIRSMASKARGVIIPLTSVLVKNQKSVSRSRWIQRIWEHPEEGHQDGHSLKNIICKEQLRELIFCCSMKRLRVARRNIMLMEPHSLGSSRWYNKLSWPQSAALEVPTGHQEKHITNLHPRAA